MCWVFIYSSGFAANGRKLLYRGDLLRLTRENLLYGGKGRRHGIILVGLHVGGPYTRPKFANPYQRRQ